MSAPITVDLGTSAYDVHVGRGLLAEVDALVAWPAHARRIAVVTQPPVAAHHLPALRASLERTGLAVDVLEVPDGELAKDLSVYADLQTRLARLPLGRDDVVVALGGGVVGDLAGFAAATYNRGVALVQVPTTLLAQVDAAIGGKTGVNLPEGKNLVGAFHQPAAVICDTATLDTLPGRVRTEGLGEVVKYGLIRDPSILDDLEASSRPDADLLEDLVRRSAAVKAAVVAADEREAGERAHLNLGHTYGHAVEALAGYGRVLHGEAVAIGTAVALRVGARTGLTPRELVERTDALFDRIGLPRRSPVLDRAAVWKTMGRDKKARGEVRFILLEALGRPTLLTPARADVDAAIDAVEERA